jgi:hypothetical protein
MGERRGACRALVEKPEGRKPLGRPRRRGEDNIKIHLREVGWGYRLDRSGSEQEQVASSCVYGDEPSGSVKCGEFLE